MLNCKGILKCLAIVRFLILWASILLRSKRGLDNRMRCMEKKVDLLIVSIYKLQILHLIKKHLFLLKTPMDINVIKVGLYGCWHTFKKWKYI